MNLKKTIALSLATLSLLSLVACAKEEDDPMICDICKTNPTSHFAASAEETEYCDYCYLRVVDRETEDDAASIRATAFDALTTDQKYYVIIYVEERIAVEEAILEEEHSHKLVDTEAIYAEASTRYSKSVNEIKALVETHHVH